MLGVIYFASMLLIGFLLDDYFEIIIAVAFAVWCLWKFISYKVEKNKDLRLRRNATEIEKQIKKATQPYISAERKYKAQIADLEKRNMELSRVLTRRYQNNPYFTEDLRQDYLRSFETTRLDRALSDDATVPEITAFEAKVPSFTRPNVFYKTNLKECHCKDHGNRHNPCKHMIRLALFVGATYDMNKDVEDLMRQYVEQRAEQTSNGKQAKSKQTRIADK